MGERREGFAQHPMNRSVRQIATPSNPIERAPSLRFAKTERAERAKRIGVSRYATGSDDRAVPRAVRVPKHEPRRHTPVDDELPAVRGSVVSAAQDDERIGVVVAAIGSEDDVVKIHERRMPTARHHAPPAISSYD